ncbi:MAG TPA: radical SAM/SPASM family putative metalloenzyme maturase [Deltaproteobacteria bacterium]|nr:radical SAM/SPASM family putative metalloenzyme maturase [Deltaproteobacteria bacterium]HXK46110.1 radical SAM/SPASM family putative metalloenzyme maturase [Deltaproteobacteria bacterium]
MSSGDPVALKPYPSKLIVETTTRCNLQCAMCMKNVCGHDFHEADMTTGTYDALREAFPSIEALVLNGIGEPLMHPQLEEFIGSARKSMPAHGWVGFQSNGHLIDAARAERLIGAGLDRICLSIDAVDPEGFRLIRTGGELAGVQRALSALRTARIRLHAPLQIGIEFVLRRDNLADLPSTIHWAGQNGADFAVVTQLFPYHPDLAEQAVYDANLDESVNVYRKYSNMAQRENLVLGRYRNAYTRYLTTDSDERVRNLVDAMVAEALARGVTLNLEKLFAMDLSLQEKTASVFEEARDAAGRWGIDLRLPGVMPRSTRRCEFVEEGCAFVSVDGWVHPCYFLWHRYRCYVNGLEKAVGPKRFGNLKDSGVLQIWNDPAYATFRKNVLRYDYPFCFNCSFALCDYVQGESFEQDCYINTEPCAACLWCMDVFQCLK